MLIRQRRTRLPHGWLLLRIYEQRSFLTVLPDDRGEIGYKREYDYASADWAERDYEQLARVCGVQQAERKSA